MLLRYREKGVLGANHLPFYWGCLKKFKGNILSNTLSKHYFKHLLFYIACQKKILRLLIQWNTYEQCFIMYKWTRILIVLHKQFMTPPPLRADFQADLDAKKTIYNFLTIILEKMIPILLFLLWKRSWLSEYLIESLFKKMM